MQNKILKSQDTNDEFIKKKIHTIRWLQVMLDRDLAELYGVKTKVLNQAVKRNIERFPEDFMFQLTEHEKNKLVTNCDRLVWLKYSTVNPFVFTEEWVYMLSSVLKSKVAIEVNISIFRAFAKMRKVLQQNAGIFQRIENVELKLLEHDKNFNKIFKAIESKDIKPEKWIFYNGQIYDSYAFVNDLLKNTKKEVTLIDNYINDTVLTLFSKYPKLNFVIITKKLNKQQKLDIEKYNSQYKNLQIKINSDFHDRFLILDKKEVYHLWASLKDLWKKIFGFSKMDYNILEKIL